MTNKNYVITKEQSLKIREISVHVIRVLDAITACDHVLSKTHDPFYRMQAYGDKQVLIPQLEWYQARLKSAQFEINVS